MQNGCKTQDVIEEEQAWPATDTALAANSDLRRNNRVAVIVVKVKRVQSPYTDPIALHWTTLCPVAQASQ